jgi:hypothetical protein
MPFVKTYALASFAPFVKTSSPFSTSPRIKPPRSPPPPNCVAERGLVFCVGPERSSSFADRKGVGRNLAEKFLNLRLLYFGWKKEQPNSKTRILNLHVTQEQIWINSIFLILDPHKQLRCTVRGVD